MSDRFENSLVLKELGFDSIWLLKENPPEAEKTYHTYILNLNDYIVLFVASSNIKSRKEEQNLFNNIALYLQSQSINESLKVLLNQDDIKIKEIIESYKYDHLFLLSNQLNFLGEEYQLLNKNKVSLFEPLSKIIRNPELKQKLWHDIQKLLNRSNGYK